MLELGAAHAVVKGDGKLAAVSCKRDDGTVHDLPCDALLPFYGLTMKLGPIADFGLNAVTGGFKVPLMAALAGAERGAAADIAKLAELIPRFRAHLESDERVEVCDDNPFGVAMSIRATLVPALDKLASGLPA